MLYDVSGKALKIGATHCEMVFNAASETVLPAWLTTVGVSPIVTFNGPGVSVGNITVQTKAATPTSGDTAGIATNFNIKTNEFSEIGFFVSGILLDAGATPTNQALQMYASDLSTNGVFQQSFSSSAGLAQFRLFPGTSVNTVYQFADAINIQKRKTLGIVIRPKTKEVFLTVGDPDDGAGVVWYSKGDWVDTVSPFLIQTVTRGAAQRSMAITKIKLRLSSY
jgi:hypothetical protein